METEAWNEVDNSTPRQKQHSKTKWRTKRNGTEEKKRNNDNQKLQTEDGKRIYLRITSRDLGIIWSYLNIQISDRFPTSLYYIKALNT